MNNQYDSAKWQENATKNLFVWRFFLADNYIKDWMISEKNPSYQIGDGTLTEYYLTNKNNKEEAIKIDVYELSSWKEATQNLLRTVQEHHMAEKLPELKAEKKSIGDTALTGFSGTNEHILMLRANMFVIINSIGNRNISVRNIAELLDEYFYSRQATDEKKAAPEILKFSLTDKKTGTNENQKGIDISVKDPLEGEVWYKFFAEKGEFSRINNEVLIEAGTSKNNITAFAINEKGSISQKMIDF